MIVAKLRGGLGNQLFQWATGYGLAQKLKVPLYLDLSVYSRNNARQFELANIGLPVQVATEIHEAEARSANVYRQPFYHFDPEFARLKSPCFLRGYFCSEKYFLDSRQSIIDEIWKAFLKLKLSTEQCDFLNRLESDSHSIALHVRRGDYVSNSGYNDFFGACSLDYYRMAVANVLENSKKPVTFYVFSDDLVWCKEHLVDLAPRLKFVDVNVDSSPVYDMYFMAACSHHIIANSTFSWWSAFLNCKESRRVITPSRWFKSNYRKKSKGAWIKSEHYDLSDLRPRVWVAL